MMLFEFFHYFSHKVLVKRREWGRLKVVRRDLKKSFICPIPQHIYKKTVYKCYYRIVNKYYEIEIIPHIIPIK